MYVILIRYAVNGTVGIIEDRHMAVLWETEQDAVKYAENSQLLKSGRLVWSIVKAPELPAELLTHPLKGFVK